MKEKMKYENMQIVFLFASAEDVLQTSGFPGDEDLFSLQYEI